MKQKIYSRFSLLIILMLGLLTNSCAQSTKHEKNLVPVTEVKQNSVPPKVTFIELGSVQCVPCKKMQPIMKSIEEKYGSQVKVIFYDVWTPLGKTYGDKYNVQLIPAQIFLDEKGKEFFRHEGFFPEEELVKVLKTKGVH
ncbi:MAG TPA: thioredoxin family protein [Paludibacter sp.]